MLCGRQDDDLPAFGKIREILVISGSAMLYVENYTTIGINNHLMSHAIVRTHKLMIVPVSNLADPYPFTAHTFIGDGHLYIAMRSDILFYQ